MMTQAALSSTLVVCWLVYLQPPVGMCGKPKPSKNLTSVQTVFRQKLRVNPQFMLNATKKITLLALCCRRRALNNKKKQK